MATEPERPEFPWVGLIAFALVVLLVLGAIRFVLGVVFGFVRLGIIVLVALLIGAAIVAAKGDRS